MFPFSDMARQSINMVSNGCPRDHGEPRLDMDTRSIHRQRVSTVWLTSITIQSYASKIFWYKRSWTDFDLFDSMVVPINWAFIGCKLLACPDPWIMPYLQMWVVVATYIVLYTHIDQALVENPLHGLLNCEIGALDCHVITTE